MTRLQLAVLHGTEEFSGAEDYFDNPELLELENLSNDPRVPYIQKLGGKYELVTGLFTLKGVWVLTPEQANHCIRHFELVVLPELDDLSAQLTDCTIEVVDCGMRRGALFEARIDFKASLASANQDPAFALGLSIWLENLRGSHHCWYQVKNRTGDLPKGMLLSEPLEANELNEALAGSSENIPEVVLREEPLPLREAWTGMVLRGQETADGLVRPEPHLDCPGHRIGSLLAPFLDAMANKREPLLLRSEWDATAKRAKRFGVTTQLAPKSASKFVLAFDPAQVPGWENAARGGQRLFAYQKKAVEFALDRDLRCLIGDEMGLGKTASAIAAAHAAKLKRVLVICPLNAMGVWEREIAAWSCADSPEPKVSIIRATGETPSIEDAEWVLIGYETLAGKDERVKADDETTRNALCAFFTEAFGYGPDQKDGNWKMSTINRSVADLSQPGAKKWIFTVKAGLLAAKATQTQLDRERGSQLGAGLRQKLMRMAKRLGRPVVAGLQLWNPELVVIDEAHRVKAVGSRRTRIVREICMGRRLLLMTGTPLRNHAAEGKALLEIILPERVWEVMGRKGQGVKEIVADLFERRMIRRLKKDVLKELPPKLRQTVPVHLDAAELEKYAATMDAAEQRFADALAQTDFIKKAREAAMGLWSKARHLLGLAKLDSGVPVDLIRAVVVAKGCAIVFAHHVDVLSRLEADLRGAGVSVGRVDGQVKSTDRAKVVTQFQEKKIQVFLGGMHAAGESITLTRAETVIFVEMDWVPGVLLQAEDRGHRAGQTAKKYHIIHLIAEIVPPPKLKNVEEPIPLPERLPKDYRRYLRTGVKSQALEAEEEKLFEEIETWQMFECERERAERLGSVENIDQHMVEALETKVAHINEVLGEQSDSMVASLAGDAGMVRLINATKQRVQRRRGKDLRA